MAGNTHYEYSLDASVESLQLMFDHTEADLDGADLMLYFGHIGEGYSSGGGIAWLSVVCDHGKDKQLLSVNSTIEYYKTLRETGRNGGRKTWWN